MRSLTCLAACLLSAVFPVRAIEPGQLRYFDVCINGRCAASVLVVELGEGRWLVDAQALTEAGLAFGDWPQESFEGRTYADLAERFPEATFAHDAAAQSLDIRLPPQAWPEHAVGVPLSAARPYVPPVPLPSGYVNYSLHMDERARADGFGEAGLVYGPWLLRGSFRYQDGWGLRRYQAALEYDQPSARRRWILGDQDIQAFDPFAAGTRIAGFGVHRVYELTPGFVPFPGADIRGVMQAPGSIDVYANDRLVARQELLPGPFSLRDLVLPQGHNDLRVVVHDPFAGTYELTNGFYASARLLKKGLHEFDDRVGKLANFSGTGSPVYGDTLLSLNHRYGFSDAFTAGARYEQVKDRRNAGISIGLRPGVGVLNLTAAYSRHDSLSGSAVRMDYGFQSRRHAFALGLGLQSADYRPLLGGGQIAGWAAVRQEHFASASMPLGERLRATIRYQDRRHADDSRSRSVGLHLDWRMSRRIDADFRLGRSTGAFATGTEAELRLRMVLAHDSLGMGVARRNGDMAYRLDVQRSPPAYEGWGYRVDLSRQHDFTSARAGVDHVAPYGRTRVEAMTVAGDSSAHLYHSGGLLWARGEWFATLPGSDGYALVSTGLADVAVARENAPVARTDRNGIALVAGLVPYHSNLVSIDTERLGADVRVREDRLYLSVPRRGVALAGFELHRMRAVQAFLMVVRNGAPVRLRHGEARIDDGAATVAIGLEGQVYFEDLPAGRKLVRARSEATDYVCRIDVPEDSGVVWLGEVQCVTQ